MRNIILLYICSLIIIPGKKSIIIFFLLVLKFLFFLLNALPLIFRWKKVLVFKFSSKRVLLQWGMNEQFKLSQCSKFCRKVQSFQYFFCNQVFCFRTQKKKFKFLSSHLVSNEQQQKNMKNITFSINLPNCEWWDQWLMAELS
jgi:hypothetical protein